MKIKMTRTENGSTNGTHVRQYVKDHEYDLTGSAGERALASAFVDAGMAVELPPIDPSGEKSASGDPLAPPAKPARKGRGK